MFDSNMTGVRGSVTITHGANIAAATTQQTTAALASALVGDRVICFPAAAPVAGIAVTESPVVTTAGVITVCVANVTTATVAAGTAVVYNVQLIRPTGAV